MRILLAFLLAFNGYLPAFSQTSGGVISASNIEGLDVEKNYILNGGGEKNTKGWSEFDDGAVSRPVDGTGSTAANLTFAVTTTNPLEDRGSFLLSKAAADAQGEGVSYDFKIPRAKRGERQCIFFDYEITSGTFTAGSDTTDSDLIVYIYDKDAGQLIEPENFKLFSNTQDKFGGCFSPFNVASDDYRLILHVANANANAWTMKIDNVKVGVRNTPRGPPVTDWVSYTPTITNGGTTSLNLGKWRRAGDSIEISIFTIYTGAGSSSALTYQLPLGLTIDTQKIPGTNQDAAILGTSQWYDASAVQERIGSATYKTPNSISLLIDSNGSSAFLGSSLGDLDWIRLNFTVPIQGWSSNTRYSDGFEGRDVVGAAYRVGSTQTGVNPNNSAVKIQLNGLGVSNLDTVSGWDLTTNYRYNIKTSGNYSIDAGIYVLGTNVLANNYALRVGINNTTFYELDVKAASAGTLFHLSGSIALPLNAGDYVELFIFGSGNNSASTLSIGNGNATRMIISKLQSGQTIASSPVVALHAAGTAGDAIGTSIGIIKFTTKEDDTHNAYSVSTGYWTAPESGRYNVSWRLVANVNLSTSQRFVTSLRKDGAAYKNGHRANGAGVAQDLSSGGSVNDVYLNAGQTLSIWAISDVTTTASTTTADNFFTVTKVGP